MEDFLRFLLIAGVILVGIFKEVNKSSKAKKARRPVPPMPSPVEATPDSIPMPEAWGRPQLADELPQPIPRKQPADKPSSKQQYSKQKTPKQQKKKGEVSVATSLASSAADNKDDFAIHSAEEARRAIIWGEILHRKY
ncbi:ferrichrome ABC transporter substrate-binding protein [Bacteroides sp. AN502(2024)]|uniref:ferrichrome ABC transporter substrate-binding protein n=1 Tax=Bacteroides sp. AN502(2024) TaxID=3160599 RepID=UPI003515038D